MNPAALVRRLLTSRAALARAADGLLDADEQQALAAAAARKGEPTRGPRPTCRCSTRPRRS